MSVLDSVWAGMVWFFSLFLDWLLIFAAPFKDLNMLWIIIPIYINWVFTDFFQERRKTAIGNAITNGAVVLWVSIDWARRLVHSWSGLSLAVFLKFLIVALVLSYGGLIIFQGIRGKDFVTRFGRVRETSYIMLMFTPVIYGVLKLSWINVLAMVVFFPVFYFLIELINKKILPKTVIGKLEKEEEESKPEMPDFGKEF